MKRVFVGLAFAIVVGFAVPGMVWGYDEDSLRIVTVENADKSVTFFAECQKCFELTVTLKMTLENMKSSLPLPLTRSMNGSPKIELVRIFPIKPNRPYRYKYEYHWNSGRLAAKHDDGYVYALPYRPKARFRIGQGYRGTLSHQVGGNNEFAVDFIMPENTEICAARDGVVVGFEQHWNQGGWDLDFTEKNNYVLILHNDGTCAEYLHLVQNGVLVKLGQKVTRGQVIGRSGNTGRSDAPHLHFCVFKAGDGWKRITIPVMFQTKEGTRSELLQGETY